MPFHTRTKHSCLLQLHFLHGFELLSTDNQHCCSVSYPQQSLRISLHGIISLGCDSSFDSWVVAIPVRKSPARIASTSAASALCCQGAWCCLGQQGQAQRCFSQNDSAAAVPLALKTTALPDHGWVSPADHLLPHSPKPLQYLKTVLKKTLLTCLVFVKLIIAHLLQTLACLFLKWKNNKLKLSHWQATNTQEHLQRSCYTLLSSNPWIKVINSTQWHPAMTPKVLFWCAEHTEHNSFPP